MKPGRKGPKFNGICDSCGCDSECRTVLFFDKRIYETLRVLKVLCSGCRKATSRKWRWPEATSKDAELEIGYRNQARTLR